MSIFVSVDGGGFTPQIETSDTVTTFSGEPGHAYEFICIASDTAGNTEVQEADAQAVTEVVVPDSREDVCRSPSLCGAGCGCTPGAPAVGLVAIGLLGMRFVGPGGWWRRTGG